MRSAIRSASVAVPRSMPRRMLTSLSAWLWRKSPISRSPRCEIPCGLAVPSGRDLGVAVGDLGRRDGELGKGVLGADPCRDLDVVSAGDAGHVLPLGLGDTAAG